jgi:hypothetical protein
MSYDSSHFPWSHRRRRWSVDQAAGFVADKLEAPMRPADALNHANADLG